MQINFENLAEKHKWYVSNDTVMGGVSTSQIVVIENEMVFSGELSLENNGGFASVWRSPERLDMKTGKDVTLRALGDGRIYQLRLRMLGAERISYRAEFRSTFDWSLHTFSERDFTPVWRGRFVHGAPPLDLEKVISIGFLLADKKPGRFELRVKSVEQ
ncbi:CIA30 family protein [Aestuariibacter salexigens]|uniref:CIA30 family protein n=1 Tax=Aestuariibacter salexigens TaxID=226010 RepID=UPI0004247D93|nr:CIA30 family protein [Aestuariibacter salexigens]